MADQPPTGQTFSSLYLAKGVPQHDSLRFRNRLYATLRGFDLFRSDQFGYNFQMLTGASGPVTRAEFHWRQYIVEEAQVRDLLDLITVAWRRLDSPKSDAQTVFVAVMRQAIAGENMGYRIDDEGGVHPLVDEQFERLRVASIAGLGAARYAAVLAHFEAAHAALDGPEPDTRTAVRETFDAVETVFKLMLGVSRLGASEVKKEFAVRAQAGLEGAERDAAGRMLASFAEWTNAAHQYRHAQGVEQPAPPSMDHAVLMMGTGSTFLRWLVTIDSRPE